MKIFVSGSSDRINELKKITPAGTEITIQHGDKFSDLDDFDIIIDLNLDDAPQRLHHYAMLKNKLVIGCAVKKSLHSMVKEYGLINCTLVGINSMPTFIERNTLELSFMKKEDEQLISNQLKPLGWNYASVADAAGMVTPRIIFMIINEAFNTLHNGVASVEDIDKGMKLGTAYPFGPFEWADKIGIKDIYETLNAIYTETNDERYSISPLLKEKYINKENYTGAGI